jgi:hypothetical protein
MRLKIIGDGRPGARLKYKTPLSPCFDGRGDTGRSAVFNSNSCPARFKTNRPVPVLPHGLGVPSSIP